jgi:hypothetical protein
MFSTKYYKVFVHWNAVLSALKPDKSTKTLLIYVAVLIFSRMLRQIAHLF